MEDAPTHMSTSREPWMKRMMNLTSTGGMQSNTTFPRRIRIYDRHKRVVPTRKTTARSTSPLKARNKAHANEGLSAKGRVEGAWTEKA